MIRLILAVFLAVVAASAQSSTTLNLYPQPAQLELDELNKAIVEATNSPIDLIHAFERHLQRYPSSARRADIEAALYKNAVDVNDNARIVTYGEKLLAGQPANLDETLDRVIRALLSSDDAASAIRALKWIDKYKANIAATRSRPPEGHTTKAQWNDIADRSLARATVLEARALANTGKTEDALAAAKRSWEAMPGADAAREIAACLEKLGRIDEAISFYLQAATVDDLRASWADREHDRKTASGLYTKLHSSAQGFGDALADAWNKAAAAQSARTARFEAMDRNYNQTDVFRYVLPAAGVPAPVGPSLAAASSPPLDLSQLRGRTLVVDFWATWCLPCVAQQPIIEGLKQRFAQSPDVEFLSLNADDDRTLVAPFLKSQKWNMRVYDEAGLAGLLGVNQLPTVLIIGRDGKIFSRIVGFNGDGFDTLLADRIAQARAAK